jgi:phosphonate transport system ATP-binding protein
VFSLDGVSVSYGNKKALKDASFSLGAGESLALIGPSGSGKTSLLRLCLGMRRAEGGSVYCQQRDIATLSPKDLRSLRSSLGFISQDYALVPNLSVLQNVLAGRLGSRSFLRSCRDFIAPTRSDVENVHATLAAVGIADKIFKKVFRLSGGEQQRVAIARALFQKPIALLADEPVSSVDPARAEATLYLLKELSERHNLALIVSLHDLELARMFFPRLIGLRNGFVAFDSPTEAVNEGMLLDLYRLDGEQSEIP